ncbi:DUF3824 domain-containing protein [Massilia sp. TN1-12]|uniref:DUF3824 domain-containing protein n=1 Tax=Massilia paldalensis TaxID=3377675 RepID=UPI003850D5EC
MANGIDWFRWHHGSVNDPKFGLVAKKAGARVGDVITVWALVLETASANTERGQFDEIDCEATDFLLGADDGTTARILAAMQGRGLINEGKVTRWEDRQPKRERVDTTAAERKRAQRERERDSERDNGDDGSVDDVTPSHATSHQVTPREEKSREEPKTPHTPQGGQDGEQDEEPKRRTAISLRTYLDDCKRTGAKAIPEGHAVFAYAAKVGLPDDFLRLHWFAFKDRYTMPNSKRYKSWPTVFHKSVQGNWLKLWYAANDGSYALTTAGLQAQRNHQEAA